MKQINTQKQIDSAEKILRLSWLIVGGAVLFSVLTVTPLVERVTPDQWDWTAPILPIVVDAAVVIVVRIDAIIARLGGRPGGWSAALRWLTGGLTLALNVGDSALKGDLVGVGVHMVAPVLLIVTAEATLTYRRAINAAVAAIEHERREQEATAKRERDAERERERAERERREQEQRADREREREQHERDAERLREQEREQREHDARLAREEREHLAQMERDRLDAAAKERRELEERADRRRREEEQRKDQERARKAREAAEAERKAAPKPMAAVSAAASTPRTSVSAPVSTPAHEGAHDAEKKEKVSREQAMAEVVKALREGRSQRAVMALTGWSTGGVANLFKEAQKEAAA